MSVYVCCICICGYIVYKYVGVHTHIHKHIYLCKIIKIPTKLLTLLRRERSDILEWEGKKSLTFHSIYLYISRKIYPCIKGVIF